MPLQILDPVRLLAEIARLRAVWLREDASPGPFWCYAEPQPGGVVDARFYDAKGAVYARHSFASAGEAARQLSFNGFSRLQDRPSALQALKLPPFPSVEDAQQARAPQAGDPVWAAAPASHGGAPGRPSPRRADDDLQRFVDAQDPVWFDVLEELAQQQKRSHWMWFVFPQLATLGHSQNARYYGLASAEAALAYWEHPLLGPRLNLCAQLMLAAEPKSAEAVLGSVDALKLRSCATLFEAAAPGAAVFTQLLEAFYGGKRCEPTLAAVEGR